MHETRVHRIWKHIAVDDSWLQSDTSVLDDISESWFARKKAVENGSKEYADFLLQLKREHAIETGIIERIYDLKKGITETFIKEGFIESYLSHGDTNIPKSDLMAYLKNHLDAVDFVFDVVKNNRRLTTDFIKELHHLVTQSQKYAEGRDQFGNKTKIPLLKGKYKEWENNPTRQDGVKILYCPPEHVASEMDNLVRIYAELLTAKTHPLIIAAWFHHAFTSIHPFQDGNGRVARLLTSLPCIQFGYFPLTVLREEAKVKYIQALEEADSGNPQVLVHYFAEVQKRNIQRALNIKEVRSESLEEAQQVLARKLEAWKAKSKKEKVHIVTNTRQQVFLYCNDILNDLGGKLTAQLNGNAMISIENCDFENKHLDSDGVPFQDHYLNHIANYAKSHDYYFNPLLPRAWFIFGIELHSTKMYQLIITIHHYGYDDATLGIGAFSGYKNSVTDNAKDFVSPLDIPPHVISIVKNNIESKKKNIRAFLEKVLTMAIAQIASEM